MREFQRIFKFVFIVIFVAGLIIAVDARLRKVEKARCKTWDWKVCKQSKISWGDND